MLEWTGGWSSTRSASWMHTGRRSASAASNNFDLSLGPQREYHVRQVHHSTMEDAGGWPDRGGLSVPSRWGPEMSRIPLSRRVNHDDARYFGIAGPAPA